MLLIGIGAAQAQVRPASTPDVSNKALITQEKPNLASVSTSEAANLHKLADAFYAWRNEEFPVRSSEAGLHTWDDRLTDYSAAKIAEREQRVRKLLDQVRAMPATKWPKDDRID